MSRWVYLALAVAFLPALGTLAHAWSEAEYQSHGFVVPFVSGWIASATRDRWGRLPRSSDARGALVVAVALAIYAFGLLAGSATAEGLAVVAAVAGAVWWREGSGRLRALAFPIGFLLFMVPIPLDWVSALLVRLLLVVSSMAAALLSILGIVVGRNGNVLVLQNGASLVVAEACSGLTAILTLLPIAVLIAHLSPLRALRRAALVALAVPIAMGANLLRVVLTALAAQVWDATTVTRDPWHSLGGVLVYAIACLLLIATERALRPSRAST